MALSHRSLHGSASPGDLAVPPGTTGERLVLLPHAAPSPLEKHCTTAMSLHGDDRLHACWHLSLPAAASAAVRHPTKAPRSLARPAHTHVT